MIVRAENVTKEFIREGRGTNRFFAVKNVTAELKSGEFTVLMGRSGSGKTTLLNMLSGLLVPSEGKILFDDKDIYSLSDRELSVFRNRNIGVIPQGQTAIYSLSVIENILLPFSMFGEKEDKSYAEEMMKKLGIEHLADVKPSELSGGELRRTAIARAVIRRPAVLLADEPTGDLDDENTAAVFDFLREYAHGGAAVLAVTHESGAEEYADDLLRMNGGGLVSES